MSGDTDDLGRACRRAWFVGTRDRPAYAKGLVDRGRWQRVDSVVVLLLVGVQSARRAALSANEDEEPAATAIQHHPGRLDECERNATPAVSCCCRTRSCCCRFAVRSAKPGVRREAQGTWRWLARWRISLFSSPAGRRRCQLPICQRDARAPAPALHRHSHTGTARGERRVGRTLPPPRRAGAMHTAQRAPNFL